MFIVVIGIALSVVMMQFRQNAGHSHEPYVRQRGMAVMNAYMDEIVRKRWNENSPVGGGLVTVIAPIGLDSGEVAGDRSNYDDIDDYNGISDSPPEDPENSVMPDYDGFSVSVAVIQPGADWNGVPAADVRHITVTVTTPTDENLTIHAYRLNF